jgi:hypothetical protein
MFPEGHGSGIEHESVGPFSCRRLLWEPSISCGLEGPGGQDVRRSQPLPRTDREQPSYLMGVTAEVVDAPRLLLTVMFWGFVSLKNDPVYWPLPTVKSAPVQF